MMSIKCREKSSTGLPRGAARHSSAITGFLLREHQGRRCETAYFANGPEVEKVDCLAHFGRKCRTA
jgi:hypothetical protein